MGIELCRALRQPDSERYVYFILLTSKSDKAAVAEGLEVGADDFLSKTRRFGELRARIRAGERAAGDGARVARQQPAADRCAGQAAPASTRRARPRPDRSAEPAAVAAARASRMPVAGQGRCRCCCVRAGISAATWWAVRHQRIWSGCIPSTCRGMAWRLGADDGAAGGLLSPGLGRRTTSPSIAGPDGPVGRAPADIAAVDEPARSCQRIDRRTLSDAGLCRDRPASAGACGMVQAGHPHPVVQHLGGTVSASWATGGLPVGLIDGARLAGCRDTAETRRAAVAAIGRR
jgi:phosphoserine phosphatase RsbU/P